jgi:arylsulfatase A-like enzyme
MKLRDLTPSEMLTRAAALGAAGWVVFGTFEYALWTLWPRFTRVSCGTAALVWTAGLGVLALYPLAGAVAGASVAAVTRLVRPGLNAHVALPRAATVGLLIGVAGGTLLQFEPRGVGAALLVMTFGLVMVVGLGLLWERWANASAPIASVWIVSLVLLLTARLGAQGELGEPKVFVYRSLLFYATIAVVLVAWRLRRVSRAELAVSAPGRRLPSIGRTLGLAVACMAVVLATGAILDGAAQFTASRPPPAGTPKPNVILIVMDTVRGDHISVNGYARKTTPNLERLAKGATVYSLGVSPGNHTLPTHASLFTGLYPASHGAHPVAAADRRTPSAEGLALGARFETLAEILSSRGYLTAGIAANYAFVSSGYNLDQGFDLFATRFSRCAPPSPFGLVRAVAGSADAPPGKEYYSAAEINEDVLPLIDRLARHPNPFFQFVNYMDAHAPYTPPAPYDRSFPGKDVEFEPGAFQTLRDRVLQRRERMTERERAHVVSQYDGGIVFLDAQLGRLFDHLQALRIYDSSLIIVTADHGEAFGERDLVEHGTSVYQDQVHVPLIVKFPNQRNGLIVRTPVSLVDILPTVLDVTGLAANAEPAGISLRRATELPQRPIISESYPRPYFLNLSTRFHHVERAFYAGSHKLIVRTPGGSELYDLEADPREERDIAAANGPLVTKLTAEFDQWLAGTVVVQGEAPQMDSETLERLRSLGYVK